MFTDEEVQIANSINIIAYARQAGYKIKKAGPRSYKITGYGGLYISADGSRWNRFSANIGGGPIQFVMHMEGKTWAEAVTELLGVPDRLRISPRLVIQNTEKKDEQDKLFVLPEKNDTYKNVLAYLIGTRKIDKQLVYDLIRQGKLYENKYHHSCVFVGFDKSEEAKYAFIRGTNPRMPYRRDAAGSDKSYAFSVNIQEGRSCKKSNSERLFVFESPIDLLSYITLIKHHSARDFAGQFISLGGVSDLGLQRYLDDHPEVKELCLGLDNDKAGHLACKGVVKKYGDRYKVTQHIPRGKDFNEDLLGLYSRREKRQAEQDAEEDEELSQ